MANLTEVPTYEAGIYRFETTDPVQGGPGGIDNLPTNQLANRTAWLKAQVELLIADINAIETNYATAAALAGHTGNTTNPHATTKAQVGLGSVENYGIATQAEAEAGASDVKYITPLRAKQAIAALVPAASDTVAGLIERATAAEAQAMSDSDRAITPATLSAALKGANQSFAISGYQKFPGGLILQWGLTTLSSAEDHVAFTFPIAFPNAVRSLLLLPGTSNSPYVATIGSLDVAGGSLSVWSGAARIALQASYFFAIGH